MKKTPVFSCFLKKNKGNGPRSQQKSLANHGPRRQVLHPKNPNDISESIIEGPSSDVSQVPIQKMRSKKHKFGVWLDEIFLVWEDGVCFFLGVVRKSRCIYFCCGDIQYFEKYTMIHNIYVHHKIIL